MISKNYLKKLTGTLSIFLSLFVFLPFDANAATLLSDDFTGTTIDTAKWVEYENQSTTSANIGGTLGNVQQNGTTTIAGDNKWNSNGLKSVRTFDRTQGDITINVDWAVNNCAGTSAGLSYGPWVNNSLQNGTIILNRIGGAFKLFSYPGTATLTGVAACENGKVMHVKMVIKQAGGVDVYIDGATTPNASVASTNTFNNYPIHLQQYDANTISFDNLIVTQGPDYTAPSVPTNLQAVPASQEVSLSWTAPNDGGTAITDYIIEYKLSTEPTTWTTFADGVSSSTTSTVTGLTNNSGYDFRISAKNSVGTGLASGVVSATPAPSAPSAPGGLIAVVGTSTQVNLSWSTPLTNGGASITDYIIEYKLSTEPTTWTTFADGVSSSTESILTDLTNDVSYDFRISAKNSIGTGAPSSVVSATPGNYSLYDNFAGTTINTSVWSEADSASGGVGGLSGNVRQNNYLTVTGNGAWGTNGVESVETFDRTDGDVEITAVMQSTSCTTGISLQFGYGDMAIMNAGTSYIVTKNDTAWTLYYWNNGVQAGSAAISGISCSNNTDLTLRLVALEAGGAKVYVGNSQTPAATLAGGTFTNAPVWLQNYSSGVTTTFKSVAVNAPIAGPYAPINLSSTPSDGEVSLSWVSGGDNGSNITDYLIEYKVTSESNWTLYNDGINTNTSSVVTGLVNGASYSFRVSAVNVNGTSTPSFSDTATPISSTPSAPTAIAVSVTGYTSVDEQMSGSYTFADPNGDIEAASTYRWLISDTLNGTYNPINGATSMNYTITASDLNKYIKFEVTPKSNTIPANGNPVLSSAVGPIDELDYFNHILSTGQSLSTGTNGAPALTTTQPYTNKMLSGVSLVPLVESSVETMSSALANTITALSPGGDFQSAVTRHGVGGTAYSGLKKGTTPYSNGITQATNVKTAATAIGLTDRVIGVTTIHGESDHLAGNGANYESYLVEWQHDYETDVKAITGQTSNIPLFTDQMSSQTGYNSTTSLIPMAQLSASVNNPGKIILVGPKYFLNYSDSAHLTAASYRHLGEYYGKVIKKVVVDHEDWRPLSPDRAVRAGNVIYVDFHVPEGVLAFDTTLVSEKTNKGFEYYDTTSSATISNVEIIDEDTVKVTLSGIPTGTNQRVRYAYTGVSGTRPGALNVGSAGGNLRDTDATTSLYGNTLYNWAVHFDQGVTIDSTDPNVTGFDVPSTANALTVDVTTFTATDDLSIAGYLLTESSDVPDQADSGWTVNAPTTYTFSSRGNKDLYAWVKDSAGNISLSSNDSVSITLVSDAPTGITATAGDTQSSVSFSAPLDNGGSEITGYTVVSSPAGGIDSNAGSTNLTHTITGLTNGQAYTFIVTATNAVGTSSSSVSSNSVTPVDGEEPVISSVSSSPSSVSANITWTTDEVSSSIVNYGLTNSYGASTAEVDISPRVTAHSVTLTNLVACTTYHYRVVSTDEASNTKTGNDNIFTTTGCTGNGNPVSNSNEEITKATGGTLNISGGDSNGLILDIPVDFSDTDASFQAQQLESDVVIAAISSPGGLFPVGNYMYELKALTDASTTVSTFDAPLTITLSYSSADVSEINESSLVIYRYDGVNWNALTDCAVDTNANTVTCTTTHFSLFGLFGNPLSTTSSSGGGHRMPKAPKKPAGGFKVIINKGANMTSDRFVNLDFNAGPDVKKIAISLTGDFKDASKEKYQKTKQFEICSNIGSVTKKPICQDGEYTIYIKFYTEYGPASSVITGKINLLTKSDLPSDLPSIIFTKDLEIGSRDIQVEALQKFLNTHGYSVALTGPGSAGKETTMFGFATRNALIEFQKANNITPALGYFGPITRTLITKMQSINQSTPDQDNEISETTLVQFSRDLTFGVSGEDVRILQQILISKNTGISARALAKNGTSTYFGALTKQALIEFQKANNITPALGYFGMKTRRIIIENFAE